VNNKEEPEPKLSPAAEEAMAKLRNCSNPSLSSKARLRCGVEGPTEFDILFESILDEQFGYDPKQ